MLKTRVGKPTADDQAKLDEWRKGFSSKAKRNDDGTISLEIDDNLAKHIDKMRKPGESDNDVIRRALDAQPRDGTRRRR